MKTEPTPGTRVLIPWGLDWMIEAEVDHTYGPPGRRSVLLWLEPEFSGDIVSERVTISMPLRLVVLKEKSASR